MRTTFLLFIIILTFLNAEDTDKQLFTAEELHYIAEKKHVTVCVHDTQYPWAIVGENGVTGASVEYFKVITEKSGLRFQMITTGTLENTMQMMQDGRCDINPIVVTKPNLFPFLKTTIPIVQDNIVLVTKINEPYLNNLDDTSDKIIAIQKGTKNLIKYVHSVYPHMQLKEIENIPFKKIIDGEIYGYIGASSQMAYKIATEYFNTLKIMSKIGNAKIDGSFGVTTRDPLLLTIINKSFEDISKMKKQTIDNAWLKIEVEKQFDYTYFFQLMSIALLIILILTFFYIRQKKLNKQIYVLNATLEMRITEEVEKNKKQQLLMLQQNRLAQMGEMISMIAHQWRQPLNSLSILNQTIQLKYKNKKLDDALMEEFKSGSKKQINQMSDTIDDFRDFFRPDKKKTDFCINDLLLDTVEIIKPILIQCNIQIVFNAKKQFYCNGYPNELAQAFINVINNAKDTLCEQMIENKHITLSLHAENNGLALYISDNAGGIPEEIIDKVFDPYFSTKEKRNGTGLGLYMSKMIIQRHDKSDLTVQNNHEGAVFKFLFR